MLKKLNYRCLFASILIFVPMMGLAQVEIVTPQLINNYGLNLTDSPPQTDRYELRLGSEALISQGYSVTIDALYLLDNVNKSVELISKTLSGQPVVLETQRSRKPYQASDDFEKIVYVSNNNEIVSGDISGTYDVIIVDRITQQTTRIVGHQPHQGDIFDVKISPSGNAIAFESDDWDFGDSSAITGYRVGDGIIVYIYDLATSSLTTPTIEKVYSVYGSDLGIRLAGNYVFSMDGQKLLFRVHSYEDNDPYTDIYHHFYVHDFNSNQTSIVQDEEGKHFYILGSSFQTESRILDKDHILFSSIIPTEYIRGGNQVFVFNFKSESVLNVPGGLWEVQDGESADGRYITFTDLPYGTEQSGSADNLSTRSGDIWVMDLLTDELKQAFMINRFAKARELTTGVDFYYTYCGFFYVPNSNFNQFWADHLSLNKYLLCNTTNPPDINKYVQSGHDAYDLSPSDIKFHNNGQYITFEANSWYLDESISYEDFTPQIFEETLPAEFQYIVERPYARDTFVVKNPFIDNTINLIGEPAVDRFSETGVYLWQDISGTTYLRTYAGGSAQGGASTRIAGTFTSGSAITSLTPLSLETGSTTPDSLTQNSANQVAFELFVIKPYRDDFSFVAEPGAFLCIDLSDYAGGLFLGPDKVEVTPPYDIDSMAGCDNPSIEVNGAPSIDGAVDEGWFIWRDRGVWHNRFVAGGSSHRFQGTITSSATMTNLLPVSIEPNDILGQLPSTQLNFELSVRSPYRDEFSLAVGNSASTCVSLDGPAGVSIYLGPDRVQMPRAFDLNTLDDCQDNPDIETLGKPVIDRTTDKGIFLWERAGNDWSVEVVTGDTAVSVIEIDIASQQDLTSVKPVGLESNDVFTVLAKQLNMSLRVKAPWYDGFEFSAQSQSATCVSTTSPAMSIFLGPDRVKVGNSVHLDTQTSCQ